MRKLIIILSSIIIVAVFLFGASNFLDKEEYFGVYLDKDVYTIGEMAIMTVWNDSPYTVTYDYNYRFQIEIDGEWKNITANGIENYTINNSGINAEEINSTGMGVEAFVRSGDERIEVIDISKLEIGYYVFIQEVKQHKPQETPSVIVHTFTEEFEIKEN